MRRRNLLIGIGATAGAGVIGTGAFSNTASDRQLTVTVGDDAAGLVSLKPHEGPNGAYADGSGDKLALTFGDESAALTPGSRYEFDETFRVGNQGTRTVYVWTEVESSAFDDDALYVYRSDPETPFDADNATQIGVGGDRVLGVYVDTAGVATDTYDATLTVHASDDPPEGVEEGPGDDPGGEPPETVDELVFDSTASLLAEGDGYLSPESVVVAAEESAASEDADGNGDATPYPDGEPLPLVAVDDPVVAFGFPFAQDDVNLEQYGNEEVLLNVLDEYAGGGTVLWDEGHGQFYDLASHSAFAGYAENAGYTLDATSSLTTDLPGADAVVITSPSDAFTGAETDALSSFADDGGLVVLMHQSDYNDFDETANLDDLAAGIDTAIRFNDDQVVDQENNGGAPYVPTSANFNVDDHLNLLADRDGIGLELDVNGEYEVEVVEVTDGDTVDVAFDDGTVETVRTVGHDAPETDTDNERPEEWEGIDDRDTLVAWGDEATTYAEDALADETVTLSFDEGEGLRGNFGRLLGFLEVDGDLYNEQLIADGYARVYDSGLRFHDRFWSAEADARANGRGLWTDSDVAATPVVGDGPVETLFVPYASAVGTDAGTLPDDRVSVSSEDGDPLVGVDANVALLGGPLPDESFESAEDGPGVDGYGNYVFLANLIDAMAADGREGDVHIDGGHGQFAADYALSAEDAAYFQRYLEGHAIGLEGTNDLLDAEGPSLDDARALVVTAPDEPFTSDEVAAIESFRDAGGAVVLASAGVDGASDARDNLDDLAAALGTDLRTGASVTDADNNLGGETTPTTTNLDESFDLFGAYGDGNGGDDTGSGGLAIERIDEAGDVDGTEFVAFVNDGSSSLDLDGYTVSDETEKTYTFSGVTLAPGETVRLYSESGSDTDGVRYWGETHVWNNGGDTVFVTDPSGTTVIEETY